MKLIMDEIKNNNKKRIKIQMIVVSETIISVIALSSACYLRLIICFLEKSCNTPLTIL